MSWKKYRKTVIPMTLFLLTVIGFVLGCLSQFFHERASLLEITFLFLPPLVVQGFGCFLLWFRSKENFTYYSFNFGATFLSLFFCYVSWVFYSYLLIGHPWLQQLWSILILIVILFIVALVVVMTFAMTRPEELPWQFCDDLSSGVKDHPFWAIMFFITLFLGTAYLFGFVLAFHDQFARTKTNKSGAEIAALRMVHFDTIDDPGRVSATTNSGSNQQAKQDEDNGANENTSSANQSDKRQSKTQSLTANDEVKAEFCFYFNDIRAHMDRAYINDCGSVTPPSRIGTNLKKPAQFNYCSLNEIAEKLQSRISQGERVRVVLVGHTSNEQPRETDSTPKRYLSNYELSEARAQNVKYEILQILPDLGTRGNIDWIVFPAADEPVRQVSDGAITKSMFSDAELKAKFDQSKFSQGISIADIVDNFSPEETDRKLTSEEKRVVIATVEPIPEDRVTAKTAEMTGRIGDITQGQSNTLKQLTQIRSELEQHIEQSQPNRMKLMDYMYFSIYTITTTGYGDIIPTTAYAKFVISLANLCEVLFLVVFFNALVSLSKASKQVTDNERSQQLPLPLDKPLKDSSSRA